MISNESVSSRIEKLSEINSSLIKERKEYEKYHDYFESSIRTLLESNTKLLNSFKERYATYIVLMKRHNSIDISINDQINIIKNREETNSVFFQISNSKMSGSKQNLSPQEAINSTIRLAKHELKDLYNRYQLICQQNLYEEKFLSEIKELKKKKEKLETQKRLYEKDVIFYRNQFEAVSQYNGCNEFLHSLSKLRNLISICQNLRQDKLDIINFHQLMHINQDYHNKIKGINPESLLKAFDMSINSEASASNISSLCQSSDNKGKASNRNNKHDQVALLTSTEVISPNSDKLNNDSLTSIKKKPLKMDKSDKSTKIISSSNAQAQKAKPPKLDKKRAKIINEISTNGQLSYSSKSKTDEKALKEQKKAKSIAQPQYKDYDYYDYDYIDNETNTTTMNSKDFSSTTKSQRSTSYSTEPSNSYEKDTTNGNDQRSKSRNSQASQSEKDKKEISDKNKKESSEKDKREISSRNTKESSEKDKKEISDKNKKEISDKNKKEISDKNKKEISDKNKKEISDKNKKESSEKDKREISDKNTKESSGRNQQKVASDKEVHPSPSRHRRHDNRSKGIFSDIPKNAEDMQSNCGPRQRFFSAKSFGSMSSAFLNSDGVTHRHYSHKRVPERIPVISPDKCSLFVQLLQKHHKHRQSPLDSQSNIDFSSSQAFFNEFQDSSEYGTFLKKNNDLSIKEFDTFTQTDESVRTILASILNKQLQRFMNEDKINDSIYKCQNQLVEIEISMVGLQREYEMRNRNREKWIKKFKIVPPEKLKRFDLNIKKEIEKVNSKVQTNEILSLDKIRNEIIENSKLNPKSFLKKMEQSDLVTMLTQKKLELKIIKMTNVRKQLDINSLLKRLKIVDPLMYSAETHEPAQIEVDPNILDKRQQKLDKIESIDRHLKDMSTEEQILSSQIADQEYLVETITNYLTDMAKEPKSNVQSLCMSLKHDRSSINETNRQIRFVTIENESISKEINRYDEIVSSRNLTLMNQKVENLNKYLIQLKTRFNTLRAVKENRSFVMTCEGEMASLQRQVSTVLSEIDVYRMRINGTISKIEKQIRNITLKDIRCPKPITSLTRNEKSKSPHKF